MKDYTHLQKKSKHKCTPTFSECAPIKCLIRNAKLLWEVYTKPLNKIGTTIYIQFAKSRQTVEVDKRSHSITAASSFWSRQEINLSCDASSYGIGAVLAHQSADRLEQSIGFISWTLSPAEKNYSQFDKKGLARIFGVKRFPLLFVWILLYTGHRSQAITKSTKWVQKKLFLHRLQREFRYGH